MLQQLSMVLVTRPPQLPFTSFLTLQMLTLALFFPLASQTCRTLHGVHGMQSA